MNSTRSAPVTTPPQSAGTTPDAWALPGGSPAPRTPTSPPATGCLPCAGTRKFPASRCWSAHHNLCRCLFAGQQVIVVGMPSRDYIGVANPNYKDGRCVHPFFYIWRGVMIRCYRKERKSYARYGGRGIKVCAFLRESPVNWQLVLGARPLGKQVDRKNNNGHYSCGGCSECCANGWDLNVRWATPKEQARNTAWNRCFDYQGQRKCVAQWAEETGISPYTIYARLNRGLDPLVKGRHRPRKLTS